MPNDFSQYISPDISNPNPIYSGTASLLGNDAASFLDPIGGMISGLFGDDKPSWKPYIDKNGNYVWNDPRKSNPVPLSEIPGTNFGPSSTYRKMADQIKAITDLLPFYSKAVAGQIIPSAQAQLKALQVTQPGFDELSRQHALTQVGTDSAALQEAQKTLIPSALAAAKQYDPEYFATRELISSRLGDLLKSINLDSGLNPVEEREVQQGLAQEGTRRGTYAAPSNLETVSNAMQYGAAGNARVQQNRSNLSAAIAAATAAIPTFKSGADVFQVATGKSSTPSFGGTAVNNALNTNASAAAGISGNANQLQLAKMQIDANKKDWADYLSQVTSSIGNLTSSAGAIAGMCWIARRVFGEQNIKWIEFKQWLFNKAPASVRHYYIDNGPVISFKATSEQCNKLRIIMNRILEEQYVN